ncbi:MAG TPA: peptidase MA family metallohydrolase, partial [Candidatus Deferrimicrobium sp.]|nr:peptidase MA family metallohydrolase [Candidatus Deferrimicrobium sp.]
MAEIDHLSRSRLTSTFKRNSQRSLRRSSRRVLLALIAAVLLAPSVSAQFYFGKNKVQYTRFSWQVMTTAHFRIYFYEKEVEVAEIAAGLAEDSYRRLAARFNHEIKDKIPLIIYSAPSFFSQTNVIPGLIPESVGGFTEFMKGRVVVPFHGSYYDFDHVIRHELVHVFTFSKLEDVLSRRSRVRYVPPPLWFTEGLAEFWSKKWDSEADMVLRDMVVSQRLYSISDLYEVQGTYFMYKLGESICQFIDSAYGPDKLVRLLENWHKGRNFDDIMQVTLGDDLAKLSEKWEYSLKRAYYPNMAGRGLPSMESRQLTTQGYSVNGVPIRWDDGRGARDWVVYKANRRGYSGIYLRSLGEDTQTRTLVKGEQSSEFESLYLLRSGIDANDSGLIVFSSKSKESDVIYVYDLKEHRVTHGYHLDGLAAARSPRLSPDGTRVVFSGLRPDGFSDLYELQLSDGNYRAVTEDAY